MDVMDHLLRGIAALALFGGGFVLARWRLRKGGRDEPTDLGLD